MSVPRNLPVQRTIAEVTKRINVTSPGIGPKSLVPILSTEINKKNCRNRPHIIKPYWARKEIRS